MGKSITYKEYNEIYRLPEQQRDEELIMLHKHHALCYEPGKGKSYPAIHCILQINKLKNNNATLKYYANPNSTHFLGKNVKEKIEKTTENILRMLVENTHLNENSEIIYTSGSSESNNLAIKGIASAYKENGKHIITSFLEHSSVSSPLTFLKEQGY